MLRLGSHRPQGDAIVDVFTPTVAADEWTVGHTVVQVITDDMPFLLDSWSPRSPGRAFAALVAHPIYAVERDITGTLQSVVPGSPTPPRSPRSGSPGSTSRSTCAPTPGAAHSARAGVACGAQRRPGGGGGLAADDSRGPDAGRRVARLPTIVGAGCAAYSQEAAEFLQWLAEGTYTFLGYRRYDLVRDPDPSALVSQPGSGFGSVARGPGAVPIVLRDASAVRAHATEPRILVLTKANSRSTVHRPVPLDYVGSSDSTPTAR